MKTSFSKTVRQAALNTIFGFRAVSIALVMAAIIPNAVYAQTWVGPGTDYNDPANWSPNTVPNNNFGQTAEFAGTTAPSTVNLSSYTIVSSFIYDAGAQSYTVTASNGNQLIFGTGAGIVNNSSNVQNLVATGVGSLIEFFSPTSASNVTLTANSGGIISFTQFGSAGAAQLIANGGTIEFHASSSGGTSQVVLNSGGSLSLRQGLGSLTIGSLAGSGTVLGNSQPETLRIGSNNLSTTFSGSITDGSAPVSLVKIGSGTLTLAGTNTYTGGTTITGGTLSLTSASAIGLGALALDAGTTLDLADSFTLANATSLAGDPSVNVGAGNAATFSGVISDGTASGVLEKTGSGTLVLSGANTYTGGTILSGGMLQATNNSALGSGTVTFDGGILQAGAAELSLANALAINTTGGTVDTNGNPLTLSGPIADGNGPGGALTKIGSGTLTLTGTNTYTGGSTVTNGTLSLTNGSAIGTGSLTLDAGTTLDLAGSFILANATSLAGDPYINVGAANVAILSGVISDGSAPGVLEKTGTGTLILSGVNTYTGGTILTGGIVQVTNNSVLGTGTVTFDGGTLQAGASGLSLANAFALNTTGGTIDTNGNSLTLSGPIADGNGAGALIKIGVGTLTLTGTNTYTGGTTLTGGVLQATNNSALGSGTVTFDGGTLQAGAAGLLLANAFAINTTGGTIDTNGNPLTLSGPIADGNGPGTLTKIGAGTLTLINTNTYTGGTILTGGVLQATNNSALGSGTVTFDGGTLQSGASGLSLANAFAINITGGTIDTNGNPLTLSGPIADGNGPGTLTKIGSGTLILSGTNTYTGGTVVTGGTLSLTNGSALGSGSLALNAGTTLDLAGSFALANTASLAGDPSVNVGAGNVAILRGVISDGATPGVLEKTGAGALILSGTNTYTGGTTVTSGTLSLTNGSAIGTSSLTLDAGTTLDFAGSFTLANAASLAGDPSVNVGAGNVATLSGVISDGATPGVLEKTGTGTLVLSGVSTYTGGTVVTGGVLSLTNAGAIGSGALALNARTTLDLAGSFTLANATSLAGDPSVNVDAGNAATLNGVISDGTMPGVLEKTGAGTLILSGINTYTGGTTVTGGTLSLTNGGSLGTGSLVLDAGTTLDLAGSFTLANAASMAGDPSVNVSAGNTATLSGVISDGATPGVLEKTGTGTLVLSGTNSYTGGTVVTGGALSLTNGSAIGTGALALSAGTTLDLAGSFTLANAASLAGDPSVNVGAANVAILSGMISDGSTPGVLEKTGTGTLILSGVNSYTGGTILTGGVLRATNNSALGSGTVTFDGGTLQAGTGGLSLANPFAVNTSGGTIDTNGNPLTLSGPIADGNGAGALIKIGVGTLTLTGTSSYTGPMTVAAGTLVASGSIARSAVTVQSGATLGSGGTVGSLVAQAGSTIAPGTVTPFTTLSVAGNASFASGSTLLMNVNAAGQSDKLAVGGTASLSGGTVEVTAAPGMYLPTMHYTLLTAAGGVSGNFAQLVTSSNLSQTFAFLTPSLSYDAHDVFLNFAQTTSFASVATTGNQTATATALQALGLGNPVYNAVVSQSLAGASQAFDALSGEAHASAVSAAIEDSRLPREAVLDRLASAPAGFWAQGFGDWGHNGSDGNATILARATAGFILGADANLDNNANWRLGGAFGYLTDDFNLAQRQSSGILQTVFASAYGGATLGAVQLRLGGLYNINTTNTGRDIIFPGFAQSVAAVYGGITKQAFGEAGYRFGVSAGEGAGYLEPFLGAAAIWVNQDGFAESGGTAALHAPAQDYDLATTTLGLRAETSFGGPLSLRGLIGWRHAYGDIAPSTSLLFAGSTQSFDVSAVPIDRDAGLVEAGLFYDLSATVKLGLSYSSQYGPRASDNAVKGSVSVKF